MDDDDFEEPTGPRDYDEQTDAFRFELDSLVYRYIDEFDINTFVMVGCLQEKIKDIRHQPRNGLQSSKRYQIGPQGQRGHFRRCWAWKA